MLSKRFYQIIFILIILSLFGQNSVQAAIDAGAAARAISEVPQTFDAGQFSKTLQQQQKLLRERTREAPSVKGGPPPANPIPSAAKIKLTLRHVIITGNTIYSDQELQKIFAPSLGKTISLSDLENLVQEITVLYRSNGYILSRAILPAQEIKNGVVKVQVIEGFISAYTIQGNPGRSRLFLQRYADHVLESKPLNIKVLEHEMLLANNLPGMNVKAVLTPSKTVPAAADLTLVVDHTAISGYVSHDNYGTRFIGPIESTIGLSENSLFPGGATSVHGVVTTKESELQYYDLSHAQLVGSNGGLVTVDTNYTQTQPLFTLTPFNLIGRSLSFNGNFMYPVVMTRETNFQLHTTANYENVTSWILDGPFYQDRIRSLMGGFYFDTTDSVHGFDTLDVDVTHGFPVFGAADHLLQSRPRGRTKFTIANLNASRLQPFAKRFAFYMGLQYQWSATPLLATEQYSWGGPIYGRGYGPSELVGDRGFGGKAEFRVDTFPDWKFIQAIEFYLFYDAGIVWNLDTLNLIAKQTATSAGFGARVNFIPNYLFGELYVAKPLTRQDFTLTPPDQNPQQARGFFQVILKF